MTTQESAVFTLHNNAYSTCSQKVRLVLAEKNITWTDVQVNFARNDHLTPEYLHLNPNGVVPTLVHGDNVIHFERVKPPFVFGELTKDGKFIFPNGNSGNQYRVIAGQIMIARTKGNWNLHLHQHLHPFIDIDQLWNDAFRMKHIQQISGDAIDYFCKSKMSTPAR